VKIGSLRFSTPVTRELLTNLVLHRVHAKRQVYELAETHVRRMMELNGGCGWGNICGGEIVRCNAFLLSVFNVTHFCFAFSMNTRTLDFIFRFS